MRMLFLLLLCSCSDIFIPENENYRSIHLNGGGWVEVLNQSYSCENGLRVFDDKFTFEIYFSGDSDETNIAGTIFSLVGKETENFVDSNCNGSFDFDAGEIDSNGDGVLDEMIDDDFIVLAVHNDPSINNVLSFYVNDSEQEITFEDIDLTDPNEFHLLQITSDGDSVKFYLDNFMVYSTEADIMIQGANLLIGAKGNHSNADRPWHGYIDEVRLWNGVLSEDYMDLHFESSDKLVETMQDSSLCSLIGLWSFNYPKETSEISDEKCTEASNLYYGVCDFDMCDYLLDGVLYTLPDSEVRFSKKGF